MDTGTPILLSQRAPDRRKAERREPALMEPYLLVAELSIVGVLAFFTLWLAVYYLTGYLSGLFA